MIIYNSPSCCFGRVNCPEGSNDFCCMCFLIRVLCNQNLYNCTDRPSWQCLRCWCLNEACWFRIVCWVQWWFLLHVLSDISDVQSEALELPWQIVLAMLALLVLEWWSMLVSNCLLGPVMISVACIIWHQWCAIRSSRITLTDRPGNACVVGAWMKHAGSELFAGSSDDFCCMYYLTSVMCNQKL